MNSKKHDIQIIEIERRLDEFAKEISEVLEDNFIGFYVFGSLTMGGWDPEKSDIDFVVVTHKPLNIDEIERLQELHRSLINSKLGRKLEGEYIDLKLLKSKNFESAKTYRVENEKFVPNAPSQITADNLLCLIQYGKCIKGISINELDLKVTENEVLEAVGKMIIEDEEELDMVSDFKTLYSILINILRCIYTLKMKRLPTKTEAIEYGKELIGKRLYNNIKKFEKGKINSSRNGNRKITRFPKKQLLEHGILMAWKYGFRVYLVNPNRTSKLAERLKDSFGLDIHTTSAYTLAVRYLNPETFRKLLKKDVQKRLLIT